MWMHTWASGALGGDIGGGTAVEAATGLTELLRCRVYTSDSLVPKKFLKIKKVRKGNHLELGIRSFLTPIFKPPDMLRFSFPDAKLMK